MFLDNDLIAVFTAAVLGISDPQTSKVALYLSHYNSLQVLTSLFAV
jgi:hypothetical protein